jgi:uncharacterized protein (TIGR02265 family)
VDRVLDLPSSQHGLDLEDRMLHAPASARVRGVWSSLTARQVRRAGLDAYAAWQRAAAPPTRIPFRMYPVSDYLRELALAGSILSPDDPGEGIRSIWRGATTWYLDLPFGRSLARLLRPNPTSYMTWLVAHRDHFCSYGSWRIDVAGPRQIVMELRDELVWIESAHRGGAEGLLDACGVSGSVEAELDDRYNGRLYIRWGAARA